jgi:Phytanoyl-CoA dioxygenase (PhyH)
MSELLVREASLGQQFSNLLRKATDFYQRGQFSWPFYDVLHFFANREPVTLYQRAKAEMAPRPIEEKIIRDLREDGISVVHVNDLLPASIFEQAQAWAEALVADPANQQSIKLVESGGRPDGKFYIVRLLGNTPVLDFDDAILRMSISGPVLRIVAGHLGMLGRLASVHLWYNVATPGPAVYSQRWHRDPEDKRIVKTFLYLRDVDETNGPFCFVRGSHNSGPFKALRPQVVGAAGETNYPEDGFVEKELAQDLVKVCTGKAGTLVFCDTTGFHRGGHPTQGARLLFNGVYTTNAGFQIVKKMKQFSVAGQLGHPLDDAAKYAIGHLAT